MNLNKDYYKILGVGKESDEKTIRKSFLKLCKIYHPDKETGDAEKFKEINEANSVLSDDTEKRTYDTQSQHGKNPQTFGGFGNMGGGFSRNDDFGDYFRNFGGNSSFGGSHYNHRENRHESLDLKASINVTLKEVYLNETKKIKYSRNTICHVCDATGKDSSSEPVKCHSCGGTGYNNVYGMNMPCDTCNGTGKIYDKCKNCNGEKVYKKSEVVEIDFVYLAYGNKPKSIKRSGYGHFSKFNRGTKGDLHIEIIPLQNSDYEQKGYDLHCNLDINLKTAILGGKVIYKHIDDTKLNLTVPSKTNNGKVLRIPNKGLLTSKSGVRGHLYIKFNIVINYDNITEDDIKTIESINF